MKIVLIAVALLAFCLITSAEPVAVGGDFGRMWISSYLAQNPRAAAQDSNNTLTGWGGTPKGQIDVDSDLSKQQNISSPSTDWLGASTILGNQTSPMDLSKNRVSQPRPFFISKTILPIHQIDSSFNQTLGTPLPDSNGFINGWPAETYDAIGPALDYF
jgi:hypothetical protein